jgi:hypothetical protein
VEIVQLVPGLPPPMEGVGTYAAALAGALESTGIETSFLSAAGMAAGARAGLADALEERGHSASLVLLHYANYGYAGRGCPFWLERGLRAWKARSPRRRLVTLFHEVYATGPPWRSSFWLSPAQRRLAARLVRLSDGIATTLEIYRRLLAPWAAGRPVAVSPVFSTVGEPAGLPANGDRPPRLAVFGGSGTRRRSYLAMRPALLAACRALAIEEIVDIGPLLDAGIARGVGDAGISVRFLGPLPAEEVSRQLTGCRAGFVAYPAAFLPKSTIFAAYCAHGLVPVCASPRSPRGGAPDGPPFWDPGSAAAPPDPAELAAQAHSWYAGHALPRQAAAFRALLLDAVAGGGTGGKG